MQDTFNNNKHKFYIISIFVHRKIGQLPQQKFLILQILNFNPQNGKIFNSHKRHLKKINKLHQPQTNP